jgi:hypothetical protein
MKSDEIQRQAVRSTLTFFQQYTPALTEAIQDFGIQEVHVFEYVACYICDSPQGWLEIGSSEEHLYNFS